MQALIVDPSHHTVPAGTAELLGDMGWETTTAGNYRSAAETARTHKVDAIIIAEPNAEDEAHRQTPPDFADLLRIVDSEQIAAIMVSERDAQDGAVDRESPNSLLGVVGRDVSLAELRGRLTTIERYHYVLQRMEQKLSEMERLGKRLNQHFKEVDQEMQLAGRLQRDFLPDLSKPIRNARFVSVFHPASWVSGDIFDVVSIDDEHTGFYIADAVGHGMAASLLTMFIKRALAPRPAWHCETPAWTPSEAITALNEGLADQSLPNCQFVTACYAILNHRTLKLQFARGGHPYPIHIKRDGSLSELRSRGGLLGLFRGEQYPTSETQLCVGDKLILYTDGLELAFPTIDDDPPGKQAHLQTFEALAHLPIAEILHILQSRLYGESEALAPRDDVTLLGVEILPES